MAIAKVIYKASSSDTGTVWMDSTSATASADDIVAPKTAMLANGILTTGTGSGGGTYQLKSYITNPNGEYIITNYEPVRYDQICVLFQLTDALASGDHGVYQALFSAGTGDYQFVLIFEMIGSIYHAAYFRYFSSQSSTINIDNHPKDTWYELTISESGVGYIDGVTATRTYGAAIDGTDKRLWLFKRANNSTPCIARVGHVIIHNKGNIKLNLIPCIRNNDNKAGLYDTINDTFYTSATSTDFVAG